MAWRYAALSSSGTFDGLTATTVGGTAVLTGDNSRQKVRNLSALATVDCETDTMTMVGSWQVSNDNSTWVTIAHGTQNAAGVVFATGTGGADATVTKCFAAPEAVYGWKYCRFAITNAVAAGNTVDTYTISYCYRQGA